jgi:diguanylate cyclase (GGDEF)-like protein
MSLSIQTSSLSTIPRAVKYAPLCELLEAKKADFIDVIPQTCKNQPPAIFPEYALPFIQKADCELYLSQLQREGSQFVLPSLKNSLQQTQNTIQKFHKKKALETQNKALAIECNIDALTLVHNRRFFNSSFERLWTESLKKGNSLSIAMMDIDSFKIYNDTYGHQAGDEALKGVASAMKNSVRCGDVLAKYGGEEFVLLLPDVDSQALEEILLRIQSEIAKLQIKHSGSTHGQITVSIGVATQEGNKYKSKEALLTAADEALYVAKKSGRNKVSYADKESNTPHTENFLIFVLNQLLKIITKFKP